MNTLSLSALVPPPIGPGGVRSPVILSTLPGKAPPFPTVPLTAVILFEPSTVITASSPRPTTSHMVLACAGSARNVAPARAAAASAKLEIVIVRTHKSPSAFIIADSLSIHIAGGQPVVNGRAHTQAGLATPLPGCTRRNCTVPATHAACEGKFPTKSIAKRNLSTVVLGATRDEARMGLEANSGFVARNLARISKIL